MSKRTRGEAEEARHETRSRPATPEARRRTGLFLRARAGEQNLFGGLVAELSEVLRLRLRCDSRTRALAMIVEDLEDVLQHTFLRLWEKRDRFDPEKGEIDGWAWAIARNAAVTELRRRGRGVPATVRLEAVADRRAVDPSVELAAEEGRQALTEAVERVKNPKVRRALHLRLVEGLSYAAVSQATGVPQGTVASKIHHLRQSLRSGSRRAA
jgi:RNA polymerase sigma-70 factor (ECF subfamily)